VKIAWDTYNSSSNMKSLSGREINIWIYCVNYNCTFNFHFGPFSHICWFQKQKLSWMGQLQ